MRTAEAAAAAAAGWRIKQSQLAAPAAGNWRKPGPPRRSCLPRSSWPAQSPFHLLSRLAARWPNGGAGAAMCSSGERSSCIKNMMARHFTERSRLFHTSPSLSLRSSHVCTKHHLSSQVNRASFRCVSKFTQYEIIELSSQHCRRV